MELVQERKNKTENKTYKRRFFSRMKDVLAVTAGLLLANCSQRAEEPATPQQPQKTVVQRDAGQKTGQQEERTDAEESTEPPFDFGPTSSLNPEMLTTFPEIEGWSKRRHLDPLYVRALAIELSGMEQCAAAKVCSSEYNQSSRDRSCFGRGNGDDLGYNRGMSLDFMEDPSGFCNFENASNYQEERPDWRWMSLGIMQTSVPPFTFWPSGFFPERTDGQHVDFYKKASARRTLAGFARAQSENLFIAKTCNPRFNPFDVNDSVCAGTEVIKATIRLARNWIRMNRSLLNWDQRDVQKDEAFAMYIAANMYIGIWESRVMGNHPRCRTSSEEYNDCWARSFNRSRQVDSDFCQNDSEGHLPGECAEVGVPLKQAPDICYGYQDFVQYVRECETPFLPNKQDFGARVMSRYYQLKAAASER